MDKQHHLKQLTDMLDEASRLYYTRNVSPLTDTEFDLKFKELQALERELGTVLPNSPTLRVGSDIQDGFNKLSHPKPMLTIENTYDSPELLDWLIKMQSAYGTDVYNISVKYDGISCELHYKDGILATGSTRGDKDTGDDITANVRTIRSIPLSLATYPSGDVYVHGEIMMPKSVLGKLNQALILSGQKPFANCRNACSGSVKQLDPKVTASRGLIFRAWDVFSDEMSTSLQTDKTAFLEASGFFYEPQTAPWSTGTGTPEDIVRMVDEFHSRLEQMDLDFDWDGIVVKVDSLSIQDSIGTKNNRSIEWGIARKWNDNEVITRLLDVEYQTGRTGNITPVGKLEPVPCEGVVISSVILNNEDYMRKLGLKIGIPVRVVRSGSVIPKVTGIATEDEYSEAKKQYADSAGTFYKEIVFPTVCPTCGTPLVKAGEIWKCPAGSSCPAQVQGSMEQWCSKECMNIDGVGPAILEDLRDSLDISNPLDLYMMTRDMSVDEVLYNLGKGYGKKTVKALFESVEKSKGRPFENILFGMGIPGIGKENARMLAREMKTLDAIIHARLEDLTAIDGIGSVLAVNIQKWMDVNGNEWLERLRDLGMAVEYTEGSSEAVGEQILAGLSLVFSGKSSYWDGDRVEEMLSSLGAKCSHSVTKKTDFLITGASPGPAKLKKAAEMGVKVVSEDEFIGMFNVPTAGIPGSSEVKGLANDPKQEKKLTSNALF